MGSEQSTHHGSLVRSGLRRGKSVPEYTITPDEEGSPKDGTISPEPSVCSDSELPYISYTVNRPIGDSPKKKPRKLSRGKTLPQNSSLSLLKRSKKKQLYTSSEHNIIVVKEPTPLPNKYDDPDLKKLQEIPMFLPIMRATLSSPAARDPEVLEKLDSTALRNLCYLYQNHMNKYAEEISEEQHNISKRIVQIDKDTTQITVAFSERQRLYSKYVEHLSTIKEMSQQLEKCNTLINNSIQMAKFLNESLPEEERLEPLLLSIDSTHI